MYGQSVEVSEQGMMWLFNAERVSQHSTEDEVESRVCLNFFGSMCLFENGSRWAFTRSRCDVSLERIWFRTFCMPPAQFRKVNGLLLLPYAPLSSFGMLGEVLIIGRCAILSTCENNAQYLSKVFFSQQ